MLIHSITDYIGNTPLLELRKIEESEGLHAKLFAKLEKFNPGGSAKDRVAAKMLEDAERDGKIAPGATIIEPTSGNTGIGLALLCACKGYRMILTMPDTMSAERISIVKAYGAEVVLTPGKDGMKGAIAKANELHAAMPKSFIPAQFDNPSNLAAHFATTGPEIWRDLDGKVDAFVAGIGTGGTISGTGRYLKKMNPAVTILGVEPAESPVITKGVSGAHGIQGIGANFVPSILDRSVLTEVMPVSTEKAYEFARFVGKNEALLVGISSGAALFAAIQLAKRKEYTEKNIVVLFPDGADRYYSTKLFG